ncbi:MAG: hypothetical protein FWB74_03995 [Defluviitaleaceae bacterium]|nr:hypothetical protein [Defluviitaleaceae bacterium]
MENLNEIKREEQTELVSLADIPDEELRVLLEADEMEIARGIKELLLRDDVG